MNHYRMIPDRPDGCWHLDEARREDGTAVDIWAFTRSRRWDETGRLLIMIDPPGRRLDITMTAFQNWIVIPAVGEMLSSFVNADELQRVPCVASDGTALEIWNTLLSQDCFDHGRSGGVEYFTRKERPDREGQVKTARTLMIDPVRAQDRHVFHISGYQLPLIVSEEIKAAIQRGGFTGAMFQRVTP